MLNELDALDIIIGFTVRLPMPDTMPDQTAFIIYIMNMASCSSQPPKVKRQSQWQTPWSSQIRQKVDCFPSGLIMDITFDREERKKTAKEGKFAGAYEMNKV